MTIPFPDSVRPWSDPGGREGLELEGPGGRVRLTYTGAHIQSYEHPREGELLFMSADASYEPGVASRGGIPIVFPWFGGHAGRPDAPAHGFARIRTWELASAGPGATVTLTLKGAEMSDSPWPHAFEVGFTVSVEESLAVSLAVRNTGEEPFRFEEALHTYFRVGSVKSASVHGLQSTEFTEYARAPRTAPHLDDRIDFVAETDRVYQGVPEVIELECPDLQRSVRLTTRSAESAIVWNPWIEKAAAMGQMQDDEWQQFVCVESANCKERTRTLGPGMRHEMELRIDAMPLT